MSTNPVTNRRIVARTGADFYPTPSWATFALIDNEQFIGTIWEPACGDGSMSRVLETTGCIVRSSDLNEHGYGVSGVDFLKANFSDNFQANNIITNHPFNIAEQFVRVALNHATDKVCMLLRLAFLEGAGRANGLYSDFPPARVYVFSERVTMYAGGLESPSGGGTTAYAWYVWDKSYTGPTLLKWLKPGYRAKHSNPDQIALDLEVTE